MAIKALSNAKETRTMGFLHLRLPYFPYLRTLFFLSHLRLLRFHNSTSTLNLVPPSIKATIDITTIQLSYQSYYHKMHLPTSTFLLATIFIFAVASATPLQPQAASYTMQPSSSSASLFVKRGLWGHLWNKIQDGIDGADPRPGSEFNDNC